ncbi:MAG: 50S ribosomal protein L15 [Spirochaetales bacterium]|nr:50S ribosomal protein L15 [Spirochaetales bacterium]
MSELRAPKNSTKKKKIVGRGQGSNRGGTSGKGHKGQNSRSGGGVRLGFEGGQMPLYRRVARRGFSNYPFKEEFAIVNLSTLEKSFADGDKVTVETLVKAKVLKNQKLPLKVLGNGEISKKLTVIADKVSAGAKAKIEKAGGSVEVTAATEELKENE